MAPSINVILVTLNMMILVDFNGQLAFLKTQ